MSEPGEPAKHVKQLGGRGAGGKAGGADTRGGTSTMRLYGLIEHEGSFAGGHYVAYVRLGTSWYRMSDSQVSEVREDELRTKQAFMLFYERASA